MAQTAGPAPVGPQPVRDVQAVPLSAPTQMPGQPVTDGAALGPGSSELNVAPEDEMQWAQSLAPYLPAFEAMARNPDASPSTRRFVRILKGALVRGVSA